jgi:hypothetical protein
MIHNCLESDKNRNLPMRIGSTTQPVPVTLIIIPAQPTAMHSKEAEKNYHWKSSCPARSCVSILNWNSGYQWKLRMFEELQFHALAREQILMLEK